MLLLLTVCNSTITYIDLWSVSSKRLITDVAKREELKIKYAKRDALKREALKKEERDKKNNKKRKRKGKNEVGPINSLDCLSF